MSKIITIDKNGKLKIIKEWIEGQVYKYRRKVENTFIVNDTCTAIFRKGQLSMFSVQKHPFIKQGKEKIKQIHFPGTSDTIDTDLLKSNLVYIATGLEVRPIWEVQYKNMLFRFDAKTGDIYDK